MTRRWCVYLAVLLGCLIFLLAYQGWVAWLLLMGLLGLPFLSLIVSLPAMLTLRATVQCPDTVAIGTPTQLRARVRAAMPLSLYLIRFRVTNTMSGTSRVLSVGDPLPTEHAAILRCTPYRCRVYDYMGLWGLPVRKIPSDALMVWPKPVKMKIPASLERFLSLGWRPKPGGGFSEQHDLRLFRPGDSANLIHWKLSAKTGKLIVREPMEPVLRKILVTLDLMGTAEEVDRKLGRLLWLGQTLLDQQYQFDLHANTGKEPIAASISTQKQLHAALRQLLHSPLAEQTSSQEMPTRTVWHCHIGGDADES